MELADIPSEGVDVSDGPRGEPIVLRPRCLTVITYEDGLLPTPQPRVQVRPPRGWMKSVHDRLAQGARRKGKRRPFTRWPFASLTKWASSR